MGNLDTNGNLYVVLPDNDPDNVTPKVNGDDKYTFTVTAQKYTLVATANSQWLGNGFTPNPQFCVGQPVSFSPSWIPYTPPYFDAVEHWTLPGTFVNTNSDPNCDAYYSEDATQLNRVQSQDHTLATSCWYVDKLQNGSAKVTMLVVLNDGRQVPLQTSGTFDVHRPTTTFSHYQDGTPTAQASGGVLSLGDTSRHNDMSFEHEIQTDGFCSGQAGYTQVITYSDIVAGPTSSGNFTGDALDAALGELPADRQSSVPANASTLAQFFDAPLVGLPIAENQTTEDVQFSTYLMFKPSGGIWVPLRLITWELHDTATYSSGWSAISSTISGGQTRITDDTNYIVLPHWTTTYP